MHQFFIIGICILTVFGSIACSSNTEQDAFYPSLITDFAAVYSDNDGNLYRIQPDHKKGLYLSNPIAGYHPGTEYRGVCTYTFSSDDSSVVKLYGLRHVNILRDSTKSTYPGKDPLSLVSMWDGGDFINLHLTTKTQHGRQFFGFRTDSVTLGTNQKRTAHLSLYHNQNNDPQSYSQTEYASLPKSSVSTLISDGDSICLYIHTYEGIKTAKFIY